MIVNSINERISCKTVVKLRIFLPCLNKGVLYSTLLYYYTTTTLLLLLLLLLLLSLLLLI